MSVNVELGDLVCYKQNLYVVSKTYKGGAIIYVDLNNYYRRISMNEIMVLNILQNMFFLSFLKYSGWSEDVKKLYLKRLVKKTPLCILKKIFMHIEYYQLTNNQRKLLFNRVYKEWTSEEIAIILNNIEEYPFTGEELGILFRRLR